MEFKLQLFGAVSAKNRLGLEIAFRDDKVRALLAYLAVERGQAHPREKLLEMFWGYAPQERAQHSLRMALSRLRQSLEQAGVADLLHVTRQTVQLQPDPGRHQIDVVEFDALAAKCREYAVQDLAGHAFVREWMERASELYYGSFLGGLCLSDSPSFDHWLMLTQSRYEQQTLTFLDALAEYALSNQQPEPAERYARRQLEIFPWQESAHRQLMRAFAQRGQRQLVVQQYQSCVQALQSELGAEPEAETIALFEKLKPGSPLLQSALPPAPTGASTGAPNNLPASRTPFFGREVERGRLIHALMDDTVPLLTVVGPGGAGKTRLTLDGVRHVLHHPAFQDGVWFVPLDRLRAGDKNLYQAIASAIAKAIGLTLNPQAAPHEQLFEQVKTWKMLLVLDNFEQLISGGENNAIGHTGINTSSINHGIAVPGAAVPGAAVPGAVIEDGVDFVLDLSSRAPHLKLLVSSRRPLSVQAEALITLDGLPVPQKTDDSAYSYSSVLLFMERGRRANPSFSLDADTLPAVVEICRILDGMPLGLELVAVRLREMSCRQIVEELTTNLDVLRTRLRDLPPRHQSMRAVFDWSWSLLGPEEKRVLSELAVFRGSFTLEAAQSITGASHEQVYALIDHSLIRQDEGRYSMHELLRQFAHEQIEDTAPIYRRHSSYYLGFVRQRADRLIRKDLVQATAEIKQEWENIQQAWVWAVEERNLSGLADTLEGLGHYLRNSGMIWFGEKLFQAGLDSLLAAGAPRAEHANQWQRTLGRLWLELARSYMWSAQYENCAATARRVIQIGGQIADPELIAGGNLELGRGLWRLGDYHAASNILAAMLPLPSGQVWLETQALNTLGNVYSSLGEFDDAASYYQRALHVQKQANIWSNRVQVLNNLATIAAMRGQFEQAGGLFSEVLAASHQFHQQYYQISIYLNLGLVQSELGEYTQAEANLKQALELSKQIRNRQNETDILLGLAQLCRRTGQYAAGDAYLQRAMECCHASGEKKVTGEALMQLALLHYAQGRFDEAGQAIQKSIKLIQELGPTEIEVDILITSGYCALAQNDLDSARSAYSASLELSRSAGNPLKEIESLAGLAHVHLKQDDRPAARELLDAAWKQIEQQKSLMGSVLPYNLYLLIAQSLAELSDACAGQALEQARALILAHAQALPDPAARQAFLQQPVCAEISRVVG